MRERKQPRYRTTKRRRLRNYTLQLFIHRTFAVPRHNHLLVLELLSHVPQSTPRDLDPGLGEEGTGAEHESDVDGGVDWVDDGLFESLGKGHVVGDSADGSELG